MVHQNGNGNGSNRWQLVVSAISVLFMIAGAMLTFYIHTMTLSAQVAQLLVEHQNMKTELNALNERFSTERADMAALQQNLVEVETQFCASDIVRNLMHANDLRVAAMMWGKLFHQPLPTNNAYYPQVCNRASTTTDPVARGIPIH